MILLTKKEEAEKHSIDLDSGNCCPNFMATEWRHLGKGLLVKTNCAGLVQYTQNTELVRLVNRSKSVINQSGHLY